MVVTSAKPRVACKVHHHVIIALNHLPMPLHANQCKHPGRSTSSLTCKDWRRQ